MADAKDRNTPPGVWAPLWDALGPLADVIREAWDDAKTEDTGPETEDAKRPDAGHDEWAGHEHPPHVVCTVLCRRWTRVQADKVDADPTRSGGTLDPQRLIDVENYLHAALSAGITTPLDLRPTIDGRAYGLYAADLREVVVLAREGLRARSHRLYADGPEPDDDETCDVQSPIPMGRLAPEDVAAIHDVVMTSVYDAITNAFREATPLVQNLTVDVPASTTQAIGDVVRDAIRGTRERDQDVKGDGGGDTRVPTYLYVGNNERAVWDTDNGYVASENGVWLEGVRPSVDHWRDDRLPDYLDPRDPAAWEGRYDGALVPADVEDEPTDAARSEAKRWKEGEAARNERLRATAMADQHRIGAHPPDVRIPGVFIEPEPDRRVALCLDLGCAARYDATAEHTGPACAGEPSKADAEAAGPTVRGDDKPRAERVLSQVEAAHLIGSRAAPGDAYVSGTAQQNARGEWVPAIPEATWRGKRHVCDCGEVRKSREAYREHYAYAHVLAYDDNPMRKP